jgi:hypothetical protein
VGCTNGGGGWRKEIKVMVYGTIHKRAKRLLAIALSGMGGGWGGETMRAI